jgi:hypothetical protein
MYTSEGGAETQTTRLVMDMATRYVSCVKHHDELVDANVPMITVFQ